MSSSKVFSGVLAARLHFHGCRSLKQQRAPLRSLSDRLRNRGLSVSQAGPQGDPRLAWIAAGCVSGTVSGVEKLLERARQLLYDPRWEVVRVETDIFETDLE
jgi:uncharacterized protein YlxP (DUF503 family)